MQQCDVHFSKPVSLTTRQVQHTAEAVTAGFMPNTLSMVNTRSNQHTYHVWKGQGLHHVFMVSLSSASWCSEQLDKFWLSLLVQCRNSFCRLFSVNQHVLHVQELSQWSGQLASLVHEAWYSWHSSLWQNRLCHMLPTAGAGLLHSASRSRLAADITAGSAITPIMHHQAKALQLQLLVRHMARCDCSLMSVRLLLWTCSKGRAQFDTVVMRSCW